MEITRIWAMPNRWTFKIKPIKELLSEEYLGGNLCDPFAGQMSFHNSIYSNDLNPETPARNHEDALEFLKKQPNDFFDCVLFDPPYSFTQASKCYKEFGKEKLKINVANRGYWARCKDEMARITKKGGKIICLGWSSTGVGKQRGFEMKRILMVYHGGTINDTLVTVERKLSTLKEE